MGLLDILKKIPSANEIKGSFGEYITKYYSKLFIDGLIIHDVLIDGKDGYTSQIDLVIVGSKGIYVVEVKFFEYARIYGDGKKSKWYYYKGGAKHDIYSPLKQNKKHLEYLKDFLKDFGDIPFYSILVMLCDDAKISNISDDPNNPDTVIITGLLSLEEALNELSGNKPYIFNEEKKQEIYNYIIKNQHHGKEARQNHKENVKNYKNKEEDLIKQKICPYCNTELVLRKGKYGSFYGCSNYPKCRYTLKTDENS